MSHSAFVRASVVVVALVACGGDSTSIVPTPPTQTAVAQVTVTGSSALTVGASITAVASLTAAGGAAITGRAVAWSSANPGIATVSQAGAVTGVSVGATTISAASEGKTGSLAVQVGPALVQSITLSAADSTFNITGTRAVVATTVDAAGVSATDRTVQWTVIGNSGIAVTQGGIVSATKPGPVTVTATLDGKTTSLTLGAYKSLFASRLNDHFILDGKPFFFGGSNSYWMTLEVSRATREANLADFVKTGGQVLRVWGSYERGSADGSVKTVSNSGGGFTTQSWDPVAQKPVLNTSSVGLQRLDELLAAAKTNGFRVIISFIDNWPASGGMDQYVAWYGATFHDEFYTDARMKTAYQEYVRALIDRVNTISGIRYGDDPTIFAWELANEPSCSAKATGLGNRAGCTSANTLEPWMVEMSAFVKSLDPNHLVSTGEIGMTNRVVSAELGPRFSNPTWPNFEATLKMPNVDFGTFHFYINEDVGSSLGTLEWSKKAMVEYINAAKAANKPAMLEEFDDNVVASRASSINTVLTAFQALGGAAFLHYQFGVKKWCDPNCTDAYEVFAGTAGYAALQAWNAQFKSRTK